MGALWVLLERASTRGAANADIRSLALTTMVHLSSNGSNMAAFQLPEVRNRLQGLAASMPDEPALPRAVDAITRSVDTITSLLELQGKQRPLRRSEVGAMLDCVGAAGVDASISLEVAHTCAAIGTQRGSVGLFISEGGF